MRLVFPLCQVCSKHSPQKACPQLVSTACSNPSKHTGHSIMPSTASWSKAEEDDDAWEEEDVEDDASLSKSMCAGGALGGVSIVEVGPAGSCGSVSVFLCECVLLV
jgi:hypothetical protein